MIRTNLTTCKRHLDRLVLTAFPLLSLGGGRKVYAFDKPIDLFHIALLHTEVVRVGDEEIDAGEEELLERLRSSYDFRTEAKDERFDAGDINCDSNLDEFYVADGDEFDLWESLDRVLRAESLIGFGWAGGRPMSSWAWLELVDYGENSWLVLMRTDDEPLQSLLAVLEPRRDAEVVSAFFRDLVASDGSAYGLEGFVGPFPDTIDNDHPELLPKAVIWEAFARWPAEEKEFSFYTWKDLLGNICCQSSLSPPIAAICERLKTVESGDECNRALSLEERKLLLDWYIDYQERTTTV